MRLPPPKVGLQYRDAVNALRKNFVEGAACQLFFTAPNGIQSVQKADVVCLNGAHSAETTSFKKSESTSFKKLLKVESLSAMVMLLNCE